MAAEACAEPVEAAVDDRYGVVLNVQLGTKMRFECHVDSNPLSGCSSAGSAEGGELVVGHDPVATDISAVEQDCSVIRRTQAPGLLRR